MHGKIVQISQTRDELYEGSNIKVLGMPRGLCVLSGVPSLLFLVWVAVPRRVLARSARRAAGVAGWLAGWLGWLGLLAAGWMLGSWRLVSWNLTRSTPKGSADSVFKSINEVFKYTIEPLSFSVPTPRGF